MLLGIEIAMLVFGIITLARGKATITRNRVLTGAWAVVVGLIGLLSLPLAFVLGIIHASGQTAREIRSSDFLVNATLIDVTVIVVCVLGVVLVAAFKSHRPKAASGVYPMRPPLPPVPNQEAYTEQQAGPAPGNPELDALAQALQDQQRFKAGDK